MTYDTELYHYGVKGMKWGVRRARKSSGSIKKNKRSKNAKGYRKNKKNKSEMRKIFEEAGKEAIKEMLPAMAVGVAFLVGTPLGRAMVSSGKRAAKKSILTGALHMRNAAVKAYASANHIPPEFRQIGR